MAKEEILGKINGRPSWAMENHHYTCLSKHKDRLTVRHFKSELLKALIQTLTTIIHDVCISNSMNNPFKMVITVDGWCDDSGGSVYTGTVHRIDTDNQLSVRTGGAGTAPAVDHDHSTHTVN